MLKILIFYNIIKVLIYSGTVLPYSEYNENFTLQRYKRVVGGEIGNIEEFPFLVSLSIILPRYSFRIHNCGGSIISPNVILTAAHCTDYRRHILKTIRIRAGSSDWSYGGSLYKIKKIIQHEEFNNFNYKNDIAVIILSESIPFNKQINSIPLASKPRLNGTYATAAGWGFMNENDSLHKMPFNFNTVQIPLVDLSECQQIYPKSNLSKNIICAGYAEGGKDACTLDSGGPLTENGELIGIISLGPGCARPNRPGIYTNIFYMHNWIMDKLNQYSF